MATKGKNNGKLFIILYIFFLLLTGLGIGSYFYFNNKLSSAKAERNRYNKEYQEKKESLAIKETELATIEEEIESLGKLSEKKEELRKEYFAKIKQLEDAILAGKSDKKIAYLTFDDGPYYNTQKVFAILDKYDVKATFFTTNINGEYCFDNRSVKCWPTYKQYLERGHTLANHTYTHAIWRGLYNSADSFMTAVINQENLIKEKTGGYVTNFVRFPGGSVTAGRLKDPIIAKLRERGYGWVDWTAEDGDGGNLQSADQAWRTLKAGIDEKIEVILMHDYNAITTSILPEVIEYLRGEGYILLPLFYESNMINK